jgi:molecular chaperone HscB
VEDPFAALGLPARFDLENGVIERAFLARAAAVHPDMVGDDEEAAVQSARLNRARAVLLDPEQRANALLRVLGGPSKEEDKSLPDGFLMEIMEVREAVEQAVGSGSEEERERWQSWARQQRAEYAAKVEALLVEPSPDNLRAARQELNAWRYIERLIEQLDPRYDPNVSDFEGV